MSVDERKRGEPIVSAEVAALVGEERLASPRGRYPTTQELAALGRGVAVQDAATVTAELEGSWRMWLDHVFAVAGEERTRRELPDLAPRGASRIELLVELERRRPGVTSSPVLMAMLNETALLRALVDALAVVDSLGQPVPA